MDESCKTVTGAGTPGLFEDVITSLKARYPGLCLGLLASGSRRPVRDAASKARGAIRGRVLFFFPGALFRFPNTCLAYFFYITIMTYLLVVPRYTIPGEIDLAHHGRLLSADICGAATSARAVARLFPAGGAGQAALTSWAVEVGAAVETAPAGARATVLANLLEEMLFGIFKVRRGQPTPRGHMVAYAVLQCL